MAFRGRRQRRSFFRGGRRRASAKTEKNWLDRNYLQTVVPNAILGPHQFIDFFALVEEEEYTNADVVTRQDEGAILRCLGRFDIDAVVSTDAAAGQYSLLWSACLVRIGSEELVNAMAQDPTDVDFWDPERRARMDILQWWPFRPWYQTISPGTAPNPAVGDGDQTGTIYFSNGNNSLEWDIRLARKLRTDQEIYMGIRSVSVTANDPDEYTVGLQCRTLLSER